METKKSLINHKKVWSVVVGLGLTGLLLTAGFYSGYIRCNYPSKKQYPIRGIDLSAHQGTIDWSKQHNKEINFVYIKATEGGDFIDKKFQENWKEAKNRNINRGAYHFFTFCNSGEVQAENFIKVVPYDSNALPPVIDLEYGGNCKLRISRSQLRKELRIFEKKLEERYHKKPIWYVTQEFYEDYIMGDSQSYRLWFRDIYSEPKIKDSRNWIFWQYANRGHQKGISTYVDLNVFNGNENEFKNLMKIE
ncbi:GH25 family lysozyme [Apibacter raozihei]|uniref:glycoside hydrolase family 25 protein n=1 Tax=Apibacter raozihei TaxID=2500547 RepID=UPI000FE2C813|nr:GH25 family lysozyme [Apibacter raozihei]